MLNLNQNPPWFEVLPAAAVWSHSVEHGGCEEHGAVGTKPTSAHKHDRFCFRSGCWFRRLLLCLN